MSLVIVVRNIFTDKCFLRSMYDEHWAFCTAFTQCVSITCVMSLKFVVFLGICALTTGITNVLFGDAHILNIVYKYLTSESVFSPLKHTFSFNVSAKTFNVVVLEEES